MATQSSSTQIRGASVNVQDHMTQAQIAGVEAGSGVDVTAAFTSAKAEARLLNVPVYVPGTIGYYRISSSYLMDQNGDSIVGDGWQNSIIVINDSGSGTNAAITVSGASWFNIEGLYIAGISGSSQHGIEFLFSGGHCSNGQVKDCNAAYIDGDGYHLESCVSIKFTNCYAEMNGGFRPGGLNAIALSLGTTSHNYWVAGIDEISASTTMNDISFVNCQSNGGGSSYGVRVGNGTYVAEQVNWINCLFQGAGGREALISVAKGGMKDCYSESSGLTAGQYGMTFTSCENFHIEGGIYSTTFIFETCNNTAVKDTQVAGVRWNSSCTQDCYMYNVDVITPGGTVYDGGDPGPTGGQLWDFVGIRKLHLDGNKLIGDNLGYQGKTFYATDFEIWQGGASPSLPSGWSTVGSPTIARENTIKRRGSYSASVTGTGTNDGLAIVFDRPEALVSETIVVEAWIYNATDNACVVAWNRNGGSLTTWTTTSSAVWEPVTFSYVVPSGTTSLFLQFYASTAVQFYVDNVTIRIPSWLEFSRSFTAGTGAAVDLKGYQGYVPDLILMPTGTTITSFTNYIPEKEYTFLLTGARTFTHNAAIKLSGAANFVGTADDTIKGIFRESDGVFYETARTVI